MKIAKINRILNGYIDGLIKYQLSRWIATIIIFLYLFYRTVSYGFIGVIYFSGLYLLYLAVQFLTPMGLPDPDEDDYNTLIGI
jgi:hypothetical protein